MLLKEIMTPDVQGQASSEPISQAARIMADMGVGALPIFEDGRAVGILTDRDIAIRAVAEGRDCRATPAGEIMTGEPVMLSGETPVEEAADVMVERQIRRLLVSGPDDEVVGIVSIGDLATNVSQPEKCGELLEQVSEPAEPLRD